jgi:hypothetical protein
MKRFLKPMLLLLTLAGIIVACKKTSIVGDGTIAGAEYTFNRATKTFAPTTKVTTDVNSNIGIRFLYCYLIRTNAPDSLIYVTDNTQDNPTSYTLNIPLTSFPANMSKVTGVKILGKQTDNTTVTGFIKITYFDPSAPVLSNFPASITANLTGGNTAITGTVTSDYGIKQVDVYDDYKTSGSYELVASLTDANSAKTYALNYAYKYRKAAQHIRVVATDIYSQTTETVVNMPVDISAFKPIFLNFAATITPNLTGTTAVTGNITSVTGLKTIDVYDDYQGTYVLITSINAGSSLNYAFSYAYTFRRRAANIRLVATDNDGLITEKIIPLNITYQSRIYRDVLMTAQTTATNTIFFMDNGTTLGNCSLNASEPTMSFLYYGTSTGPSFYSPTNTSSVASNFKCSGASWVIANASNLRATRFRVLVQGASTGIDNIYTQYNAGNIDVLDDAFFTTTNGTAIPAGSSARFDPTVTATTSIYNLTNAYLIWVRVPTDNTNTTYKNGLIRVKTNTSTTGTSTVTFDIIVQN